ncbi:MAG TPA: 4-alpha-glucanotransferase [Steroidobacteraceae bacterium]|nr:4-alpha-glucanotransferase [Steroidobacteraceae bacterium]
MGHDELVGRLANLRGIGDAYYDYRGALRRFGAATKAAILRAMGVRVEDEAALRADIAVLEAAGSRELAPRVAASNGALIGFDIHVSALELGAYLVWSLRREDGVRQDGAVSTADCAQLWRGEVAGSWITRRRFELPARLPPGYHELELRIGAGAAHRCLLIMSPPACHEPPALGGGRRVWGVALQLYTVRSRGNWGVGDFADLAALIRGFAAQGAGFVGLNPLHALATADPEQASPYAASDRRFLNVLYIAVPSVAEFGDCAPARGRVAEESFQARLAALRTAALVDYRGVADAKLEILALLHEQFCDREMAQSTQRAAQFAAFVASGGEALERHARFEALDRYFRRTRGLPSGWMNWPEEYHDPAGTAVADFAALQRREVDFFLYLQWLAEEQLAAAQALARRLGMPIGLYGDYAVGAAASGSEVWSERATFCLGAEIGAPPDPLALQGQGWGVPPPEPLAMQREGFAGFRRAIRDNMRRYGALRLDHVMSLFRLWWVSAGASPADGGYVHYPLHTLMTVLALESARAGCLVVGEDLGVVPDEVREAMGRYGMYQYKVMIFEKDRGRWRAPGEYPRRSLATVTTHDMPTIRSYWQGSDIELATSLALYPSAEVRAQVLEERAADRAALLGALRAAGLAAARPAGPQEPFAPELAAAMHGYLAHSGAALVALQLEDLLGMTAPVNVPGTHAQYPNWRRKIEVDLEDILARPELLAALAAVERARR